MSERMGMADGRCFTNYESSRIMNDKVMNEKNIPLANNYVYRQRLARGDIAPPSPATCLNSAMLPKVQDYRMDFIPSNEYATMRGANIEREGM